MRAGRARLAALTIDRGPFDRIMRTIVRKRLLARLCERADTRRYSLLV